MLYILAVHSPIMAKLYVLAVPPMRAACFLLLWQADCVDSLVGLVGAYSGWLPGHALAVLWEAVGYWLVEPSHDAADCSTPGGPGASPGSLVGGIRVQKTLGLLPTY